MTTAMEVTRRLNVRLRRAAMRRPYIARGRIQLTAARHRAAFEDVEAFCLFVGYPRSGHSLLGALVNAHPDAVISHELHAMEHLDRGRDALFASILVHDRDFGGWGRRWEGYDYTVPGSDQGRFRRLRVIGDKKGGGTALHLLERPADMDRLRDVVRVPLRVIHMTRNPFDNVATIANRTFGGDLDAAIAYYKSFARGVEMALERLGAEEVWHTRHEDLVGDPRSTLVRACGFLDLEASQPFLDAACAVVVPTPSRTRKRMEWHDRHRAELESFMTGDERFASYRFGD